MDLRELIEKYRIPSGADMTAEEKLNYISSQDDSQRTLPQEQVPEFIMSSNERPPMPDVSMPSPPQGLPPVGSGMIPPADLGSLQPIASAPQEQIDPQALKSAEVRQQLIAKRSGENIDPDRARKRALLMNSLLRGISKVAQHGGVHGTSVKPDLSVYDQAEQRLRGEDEKSLETQKSSRAGTSVQSLRKEFNSLPSVRSTEVLSQNVSRLDNVWENYIKNPEKYRTGKNPVDQAIIMTFNKVLDPNSVVRESEYARVGTGLSFMKRLEGYGEKLKEGGAGLTDSDRQDIMTTIGQLYKGQLSDYKNVEDLYTKEANYLGYDPTRIIRPFQSSKNYATSNKKVNKRDTPKGITGTKLPPVSKGTTRMYKNGKPYDIPNEDVKDAKNAGYKVK